MVDLGSKTPKTAEMPAKQGKTQQDHDCPHHMNWLQISPEITIKQGKKRQRDQWFHFRTPTWGGGGWRGLESPDILKLLGAHVSSNREVEEPLETITTLGCSPICSPECAAVAVIACDCGCDFLDRVGQRSRW